jgi:hypothetical protein
MDKIEFIKQLRITAEVLEPLAEWATPATSGTLKWNGVEYAKVKEGEEKVPEPSALVWRSVLTTIADLREAQKTPLSDEQIAYLNRLLFGGMGSLNDVFFDSREIGSIADTINYRLDVQRTDLFNSFKK